MNEPITSHRLVGLEPDNLLAFMAMLGLAIFGSYTGGQENLSSRLLEFGRSTFASRALPHESSCP